MPAIVFGTMLPGLLYFELAFEIYRSVCVELALWLFPASSTALLLRTVCAYEAINVGVMWTTKAPISGTSMYVYVLMLMFDLLLYSGIMYVVAVRGDRKLHTNKTTDTSNNASSGGSSAVDNSSGGGCASFLCCFSSIYLFMTSVASIGASTVRAPVSAHPHHTAADIEEVQEGKYCCGFIVLCFA